MKKNYFICMGHDSHGLQTYNIDHLVDVVLVQAMIFSSTKCKNIHTMLVP